MAKYQLVVIGAGPGGYEAALRAAELGMKTAIIEKKDIGGTCLNRGCVPTKTLIHSAELVAAARESGILGVHFNAPDINMSEIFARKRDISTRLCDGVRGMLDSAHVDVYSGLGTVCGDGKVKVSGEAGEEILDTENVLLATGLVPSRPPIPGLNSEGVMTSDELLLGDDCLYSSLIIIGGGVIGVELAVFYHDLGCKVTIVEGMDRLLPNLDKDLGQNLANIMKKQGINVITNAMVSKIHRSDNGLSVAYSCRGKDGEVSGEKVLCAIGRVPDMTGLFADGITPESNHRQIKVDKSFKTSIPGVYAIGDISSKIQLAHVATAQGRACVEMIAGVEPSVDLTAIPSCVYCVPEISCTGMSVDEAKEAGYDAISGKSVMGANARTMILDAPRSFMKVVADRNSHRILGAQLMCPNSTDMISEFTEAIINHLTVEQMIAVLRPHPTFEECAQDALRSLKSKLT